MIEDSIPPLLLQTIITIPIFWYTKKGGPKGKLVMNEEMLRTQEMCHFRMRSFACEVRFETSRAK